MEIEVTERRLVELGDGRMLSLKVGVSECDPELGKELIALGYARKPVPPPKQPILKETPAPAAASSAKKASAE